MDFADRLREEDTVPFSPISVGQTFKPYAWKANHDMDFRSECLYCDSELLRGYTVEDESGKTGRIAVCPDCERINAKY